jgi:hypothetical protein
MSDENKKAVAIDLNELQLEEEPLELNPEADPSTPPPPPPDGIHLAKLKVFRQGSESGWTRAKDKNGNDYIGVRLELRIVAPGEPYDDRPVFDRVNTIVMQGTGTASIMGPLRALKVPVPTKISKVELAKLLATQLEGEPTVKVETRWEIREEQEEGKWKTVRRGMKKFPPKHDANGNVIPGEYDHTIDGLHAQATVVRYLPA